MDCKCKKNPKRVCYICSNAGLPNCQAKITDFVKKAYCDYFVVKLGNQDKPINLPICYKTYVKNLKDLRNDKRKSMPFAIPEVWREEKYHIMDCNVWMINLKGINCKIKYHVQYPDVSSTIRPNPHGPDLPVLEPDGNMATQWA